MRPVWNPCGPMCLFGPQGGQWRSAARGGTASPLRNGAQVPSVMLRHTVAKMAAGGSFGVPQSTGWFGCMAVVDGPRVGVFLPNVGGVFLGLVVSALLGEPPAVALGDAGPICLRGEDLVGFRRAVRPVKVALRAMVEPHPEDLEGLVARLDSLDLGSFGSMRRVWGCSTIQPSNSWRLQTNVMR